MDFSFLYDPACDLLSIGYDVSDRRRDPSYYDLLASEARLASFMLIAQDQVPQEHWFALGRQLTTHDGALALLSWSGSMFEYLMPLLVMPTYEHTLLDETYRAVVARQIEYGRQRGVPWGISESCYNATDARGAYQYRAFGVPGLGFKRGLADDLVVAPYASALALMVAPRGGLPRIWKRLAADGYHGAFGLYEAIDFTPDARAARQEQRAAPQLHGAPPGDEPAGAGVPAAEPAHAAPVPVRPAVQGDGAAAAGAHAQGRVPAAAARGRSQRRAPAAGQVPRRRCACSRRRTRRFPRCTCCPTAAITSWPPTRAAGTAGGRTWRSRAGGRTRRATAGALFCYLRDADDGRALVVGLSTDPAPVEAATRRSSCRAAPSSAAATTTSTRHTEIAVSPEDDVEVRRVTLIEPVGPGPDDRADQLRGGRPRAAERRPRAPGLQQPVRADRDPPRTASHPVHAPAARARRAAAVDVPSADRAGHAGGRGVLRNGPGQVHRPLPLGGPPGRVRRRPRRSPTRTARCSIRSSRSARASSSSPTPRPTGTSSPAWPRRARRRWR